MNRSHGFARLSALTIGIIGVVLALGAGARAATVYWTGAISADWNDPGNWSSAPALPANDLTTDIAAFNTFYSNQPMMNVGYSVNGLSLESGSGEVTIGGTNTLSLGAGGIAIATGAGNANPNSLTINAPVNLGADQTWGNASISMLAVNGTINTNAFTLTVNGTGNTMLGGAVTGAGNLVKADGGMLILGSGGGDTFANTFTGTTTLTGGTVLLNKASGTDAIRGNLVVNGSDVQLGASNIINDASNITVSAGTLRFYNNDPSITDDGRSETFASLTLTGGTINTTKGAPPIPADINITGAMNLSGGTFQVNSSAVVTVGGMITVSGGTGHVIGGGSSLRETRLVANSGMTFSGGTIGMNWGATGALGGRLLLNGDVTVNGTGTSGILLNHPGTTGTVAPVVDLGGVTRTFNVADSAPGMAHDMVVGPGIVNGAIIKNGPGSLFLGSVNTFTAPIVWNEGILGFGTNISESTDGAFGNFAGPLTIPSVSTPVGLMGMSNTTANNITFDRPIVIPAGTGTFVLGARSISGAAVTANYAGTINLTRDLTVDANAQATANFNGTMSGAGRKLIKTGAGAVRLTGAGITPFTSIEYNAGTVQFAPGVGNTFTQGGAVVNEGNIQAIDGTLDFGSSIITTTNRFTTGFREGRINGNFIQYVANAGGAFNLTTSAPNVATFNTDTSGGINGWISNSTYIYSGQIYVPDQGGGLGSFSMAESFDDSVRITVDGVQRLNNTSYNTTSKTGTITLQAGWHTIELRFGQGAGSVGRYADATNHWGGNVDATHNGLGFGYNSAGLDTLDGFSYVAATDDGLMSLFRTPTSMLIADAGATIKAGGFTKNGVLLLNGTATTAGAIQLTTPGFTSDTQTIQVAEQADSDTNPLASITLASGHVLNTANLYLVPGSVLSVSGGTLNIGQSDDPNSAFSNWAAAGAALKVDGTTVNFLKPTDAGNGLILDLGAGTINISESGSFGGLKSHGSTLGALNIAAGKSLTLMPPTGTTTFGAPLAMTGDLIIQGTGTQALGVDSPALNGNIIINSGTLQGNTAGSLNARPITLNGGTLALFNDGDGTPGIQSISYGNNLTVAANATIAVNRVGTVALNKRMQVGNLAIGASTLTITNSNGCGLEVTGATTFSGAPTFSVATLTESTAVTGLTLSGVVSGPYGFTKTGAGVLGLTNSGNTFGGPGTILDITGGVLAASSNGALGDPANQIQLNSASTNAFRAIETFTTARTFILNQATNAIEVKGGKVLTLTSPFAVPTTTNALTKQNSGILELAADNTGWDGVVTVGAGVIRVTHPLALGSTVGNTVVGNSGATGLALQIAGGINVAEPLSLAIASSDGGTNSGINSGGALQSVSGNNIWSGPITLVPSTPADNQSRRVSIGVDAGSTLDIAGGVTINYNLSGTNRPNYLLLTGDGTGTLSSVFTNTSATPGITAMQKTGWGTWNVTAPQTYTGMTYVLGGTLAVSGAGKLSGTGTYGIEARIGTTLTLDDSGSTQLTNRSGGRPMALQGATLNYIVNSTVASSETIGALTVNGGAQTFINVSNPGAQNSTLTFASLTVGGGSSLNLTGALGSANNKIAFTTAPTLNDGIMSARVTVGGTDFATYDATNGVAAYAAYNVTNDLNAAAATANMKLTATPAPLAASKTINSLLINGSGLTVAGAAGTTLTIDVSGLLVTGGANTISVPTLKFGDGTNEAVINVNTGATLNLNSAVSTTGDFNKTGGGTLVIKTPAKAGGVYYFSNGLTTLDAGNNTIPAGEAISVGRGATLDLNGTFQVASDFYSTTGSTHPGAGGTLTGPAASMLTINQTNNARTFAGSITGGMSIARFGQNTWTLNNPSTYTGATILAGGTTTLADFGTLAATSSIDITSATLFLDNSVGYSNGNRVNDAAPITLRNGTINFETRIRTYGSETLGAVTLDSGQSTIQSTYSTTGETSGDLILTSLSRTPNSRAAVRFVGYDGTNSVTLGQIGTNPRILITTPLALTNNLIGPWATNQREWASYNPATGVGALNAAGFAGYNGTDVNAGTPTANIRYGTASTALAMTADRTINTLLFNVNNNTTLDLGGFTLTLAGGGLLAGLDTDNKTITFNNGQITSGTPGSPSDLYFYASGIGGTNRSTVVNANIVDNGPGGIVTLVKGGDHKMTLTGANTYTGGTFVNQGSLELSTPGADGTTLFAIPGDLTTRGATITALAPGQFKNTAKITLLDGGTFTLNGDNALASLAFNNDGGTTTPTVTTGGVLTLTANAAITAASKNLNNTATINGTVNLAGSAPAISVGKVLVNGVDIVPGQAALTIAAQVQGTNGFTKTGDGALALSNVANAWSGATTVDAGILRQTAAGALSPAAGYIVNTAGTLDLNGLNASLGSLSGTGTVINPGAAMTLTLGANNASTSFAGLITAITPGNLGIIKSGTGTMSLTNPANSFAGGITVNNGALILPGSGINTTGSGLVTINSGGAITGGGLVSGGLDFEFGASANIPLSATAPINTGTGLLIVNGQTTLNLTGTASAGSFPLIKYGNTSPLAGGQFASFKLGTTPGGSFLYGLIHNTAASTIDVSVETVQPSTTWTGAINGTWDIGTTANWGGGTTYNSPNQAVFNDGPVNTAITGPAVTPQAITVNANTASYSIANNIGGAMVGGLTKSGASTLTLTGNNTFSGAINVAGGSLRAAVSSSSSGLGAGAITLADGTTLQLDATASMATNGITGLTYSGAVTSNFITNKDHGAATPLDSRTYANIDKAKSTSAFYTGGPADNHTMVYMGKINLLYPGSYGFFTQSDDGSRLFIDGQLVVNNDGSTSITDAGGVARLSAGLHDVRLEYSEGTGDSALSFSYQGPGLSKQVVPTTALYTAENASGNLINLGNALRISGTTHVSLGGANFTGVQMGLLNAAADSTLNVVGPAGKTLRMTGAVLAGNTTFNSAADTSIGQVTDLGSTLTLTKTGTGRLILDNTEPGVAASSLLPASSVDVRGGKLVLQGVAGGTNPAGQASIQLNGGGLVLDSRAGGATFDNVLWVNQNAAIEVVTDAQTQVLGSPANGMVIADGKTLTIDVYGGSRNGAAANSLVRAPGAGLTIAAPISGNNAKLVIQSTQFNALKMPVNGTVNFTGNLSYTGATTFIGAPNPSNTAPLTVNLAGDATFGMTSTFSAPVTLVNTRIGANNSVVNLNRVPDSAPIALNNSGLTLIGSTTAPSNESFGDVTLASGFNEFQVQNLPGANNTNTLVANSLARTNRSTAYFTANTLGTSAASPSNVDLVQFTAAPTADLVGGGGAAASKNISILPYAIGRNTTGSLTKWGMVTYDLNGIRALAAAEYTTLATTATPEDDNTYNSYSAALAITGRTVNATVLDMPSTSADQTATLSGTLTLKSGQLIFAATGSNKNQTLTGGNVTFGATGAAEGHIFMATVDRTATVASTLTGSNGLTISSLGGMLNLTGNNAATLTGAITLNGALVQVNADAALGAPTNPITLSGGFIRPNAAGITFDAGRTITIPANSFGGFDTSAQSATVASKVTGSGTLWVAGANTVTLTNAANDFSGPIYIQGGTLVTNINTNYDVVSHGTFGLNLPADTVFTRMITGLGGVAQYADNVLSFSQPQAYAGATGIRRGTIRQNQENMLPYGTPLVLGDAVAGSFGTYDLNDYNVTLGSITATALATNGTVSNAITNLNPGRTLSVLNQGAGDVLNIGEGAHVVISGGGDLDLRGPAARGIILGYRGTSQYYGLDVTSMSSVNASFGSLYVGYDASNQNRYGTLDLSRTTNAITATDAFIGWSNSNGSVVGRVNLGATNTLNANNLTLGWGKANGVIQFNTGLTNPTLAIRGAAGGTSRANLTMGVFNQTNSGTNPTGTLDLTVAGRAGSIDALFDKVVLGSLENTSNGTTGGKGYLTFNAGAIDINTLILAQTTAAGTKGSSIGTLSMGGGTLAVNTEFALGKRGETSGTTTATATFNLTGGVATINAPITTTASSTSALNLDGGTLDMTGKAIGTAADPIDTLTFDSGTLKNAGPINGTAGITKTGPGTLYVEGTNTFTGPTTVTTGVLNARGSMTSAVTVNTGATFEAGPVTGTAATPAPVTVAGLAIGTAPTDAAAARITSTVTGGTVLVTPTLALTGSGSQLDMDRNGLVLNYDGAIVGEKDLRNGQVRQWIKDARNTGNWDGATGITSKLITPVTAADFAVGYRDSSAISPTGGTFMGQTVDGSAVTVRYTVLGDSNLDGQVNFIDLVAVAQNYNTVGTGEWGIGDFNYDNDVNFIDLVAVAQHYNQALPAAGSIPGASADFQADWNHALAIVPEPGTLSLLAIGSLLLMRRRNRLAA